MESRLGPLPDPTDPLPVATAKVLDVLASRPDAVVIGGDTIVDLQGQALGKPDGAVGATEMLRRLQGRRHAVRSAVAVAAAGHPRPSSPRRHSSSRRRRCAAHLRGRGAGTDARLRSP